MGVVSHRYGGLHERKDIGDGEYSCGTKPGVFGCMSSDTGTLPECEVKIVLTPDQAAFQVRISG